MLFATVLHTTNSSSIVAIALINKLNSFSVCAPIILWKTQQTKRHFSHIVVADRKWLKSLYLEHLCWNSPKPFLLLLSSSSSSSFFFIRIEKIMAQTIDAQVSFVREESLFASFVRFMLFHFSIFEWWIFVFFFFSFSFLIWMQWQHLCHRKSIVWPIQNGFVTPEKWYNCLCMYLLFSCWFVYSTHVFLLLLLFGFCWEKQAHKGVCHWFAFEQCNLRFMSPC